MNFFKSLIVAAAALAAAQAHAGYTYTYSMPITPGSYSAPIFDASKSFQATVQTTSVINQFLAPQGTTGPYLVISSKPTGNEGYATIDVGGASSYSFIWGSPDLYNFVDIFGSASGAATTYSGAMLNASFGTGTHADNGKTGVFTISGAPIDHLVLRSQGVAFEVAAPVPEPETYALMLAGLGALGFVARRRSRDSV